MEQGKLYHLFNRGNNRELIFFEEDNYRFFLKQFGRYLSAYTEILAYCLMPNHFHFLARIKIIDEQIDPRKISQAFRDFFISYSKAINKRYNRTGALFQQKFKKKQIDSEAYFSWIVQYIHMNPVKAGLCNYPSEWKYSSYNAIISNATTRIRVDEVLGWFGGVEKFAAMHKERAIDERRLKIFLFE